MAPGPLGVGLPHLKRVMGLAKPLKGGCGKLTQPISFILRMMESSVHALGCLTPNVPEKPPARGGLKINRWSKRSMRVLEAHVPSGAASPSMQVVFTLNLPRLGVCECYLIRG